MKRVSVISTGSVRIRPQHEKSNGLPTIWWFLTSWRWTPPRPINVYVIEHERGLVVFDTGQDRRSVTDPDYFPLGVTGFLYRRLARFAIREQETLTEGLRAQGYRASDVTLVVLSHLHQDHIGGLAELSDAEIVVSAAEWATLSRPFAPVNGLLREHIELPGLRWNRVTLEATADAALLPFRNARDLFGDGSLVLLPTPGHTPGSLSLLVRQAGHPPILLVGDLTYDVRNLEKLAVPGIGRHAALVRSTRDVNDFVERWPGTVVLAAHDPAAAGLLESAWASVIKP